MGYGTDALRDLWHRCVDCCHPRTPLEQWFEWAQTAVWTELGTFNTVFRQSCCDLKVCEERRERPIMSTSSRSPLMVEVVSDLMWPWCWVAKRKLESAIATVADKYEVTVRWRPFMLRPNMPPEGVVKDGPSPDDPRYGTHVINSLDPGNVEGCLID